MSSIRRVDEETIAYIKGGPKEVLNKCALIFDGKNIRTLTAKEKENILKVVDGLAADAMRNLALAYKPLVKKELNFVMDEVEKDLIFL